MASTETLDQLARIGIFNKRYESFALAPPDAQKVIRLLAERAPELPPEPPPAAPRERRARAAERLAQMEASIARLERSVFKIADALARIDQLDLITSAARLKANQSDKIRAGLAKAARTGKHIGRPRHSIDGEVEALRKQGMSTREIARRLKVSAMTVSRRG